MKNQIFLKITSVIFLLCALTAMTSYALQQDGAFLPRWIQWEECAFEDGSGNYRITLSRKKVTVTCDDIPVWTSPENVKVQVALSADVDNDSEEELVLLCWKMGRYGRNRPFWVKEDKKEWSQHLFVYDYFQGGIRPQWMSSYLGRDLSGIAAHHRADGANRLLFTDLAGETSCWRWDSWGFTLEDASVSFLAFGDNLIHESLYRYGLEQEGDFGFLFENFREALSLSDVAIINQETPLVDEPALYSDYPRFGTPVGVGEAIAVAGFHVVTCATNHALDKGKYGINTTKEFFEARDILCLGIQSESEREYQPYEIITKKGIRFALFNYTYGTNGIKIPEETPHMVHLLEDAEKIKKDIERAREEADFVILFVHWGTENSSQIDGEQEKWARVFLDSRVDVVVGTHPHALQPVEVLTAKEGHQMLVYYSLGNYISAQSEHTAIKGGQAWFTVSPTPEGYKITEYSLTPLSITWHKGGRYTTDYACMPNPAPDSLSSNSASGMGLE